jgi:hypothetical protein
MAKSETCPRISRTVTGCNGSGRDASNGSSNRCISFISCASSSSCSFLRLVTNQRQTTTTTKIAATQVTMIMVVVNEVHDLDPAAAPVQLEHLVSPLNCWKESAGQVDGDDMPWLGH